jgi:Zn-dependent alcohol dehydrogenase
MLPFLQCRLRSTSLCALALLVSPSMRPDHTCEELQLTSWEGVCRTDIHICDGEWKEKSNVELPYTIGHENAGWVHQVGSSVSNVKVGDKVILHPLVTCGLCTACRFGDDVHCGKPDVARLWLTGVLIDRRGQQVPRYQCRWGLR